MRDCSKKKVQDSQGMDAWGCPLAFTMYINIYTHTPAHTQAPACTENEKNYHERS